MSCSRRSGIGQTSKIEHAPLRSLGCAVSLPRTNLPFIAICSVSFIKFAIPAWTAIGWSSGAGNRNSPTAALRSKPFESWMNGVDEPIRTTLIDVVSLLEQKGVRYVLIGGLAASLRGQPRVTADIDLVIGADVARALRLMSSLATSRFEPFVPDFEEVVKRSFILPLRHRYTGVKVDMALGLSGFEQQLIDRAEKMAIAGQSVPVATAEDLLLMKVLAGRSRDDQDIHGIIAARGATMDWDYCRRVARDLGEALSQDLHVAHRGAFFARARGRNMIRIRILPSIAAMIVMATSSRADDPPRPIDVPLATKYFQEAARLWKADGGKLWGRSLEGPLMFVDRTTRQAVANRADAEGQLHAEGGVFTGKLPDTVSIANTSTKWAGVDWIMILWPLPTNDTERRALMMHESWHRIQKEIGFPSTGPGNVHLDTFDGRYWLQLEWCALAVALRQRGDPRRQAIEDALVFRAERRTKFKDAASDERLMEMHEGLAEYTGVRLCGVEPAGRELYIAGEIDRRPPELPTFVRSFAYLSGPAYGLLLDDAAPDWQHKAKSTDDFGTLLQTAVGIKLSEPTAADLLAAPAAMTATNCGRPKKSAMRSAASASPNSKPDSWTAPCSRSRSRKCKSHSTRAPCSRSKATAPSTWPPESQEPLGF